MTDKEIIIFVTSNEEKIADIKNIIGKQFYVQFTTGEELIELQSLSVEQVAAFKAKQAFERLSVPVVVSDSGLEIEALRNFPGALVKFVNETIGQDGIIRLMNGIKNRRANFVAAIAYCNNINNIQVFVESDEGNIATKPRGEGWHFDKIFIPLGESRTWAEIGRKGKNKKSAFLRALKRLATYLNEKHH